MIDPYVYSGTEVLINKEDIRDQGELDAFERVMTAARMETLPTQTPLTEDGYRRLHRYIFQDVYDWDGEYRTVNIAKGGHMFCLVPYIGDQMIPCREMPDQPVSWPGLARPPTTSLLPTATSRLAGPSRAMTRVGQTFRHLV